MKNDILNILLADDDEDDRLFFLDAFRELRVGTHVNTVVDGEQLMSYLLEENIELPDLLFLDLNMPLKGGMECLQEIRSSIRLKHLTIAIYSTSASEEDIERTFVLGANVYIKKPNDFPTLKKLLLEVITVNLQYQMTGMDKDNFLLNL